MVNLLNLILFSIFSIKKWLKREQDILKDSSQVTHKLFYVWFYISHISSCEPAPLERLIQNFQRLYNKTSYFYKTEWMCGKIYAFPTQNHRCSDGGWIEIDVMNTNQFEFS